MSKCPLNLYVNEKFTFSRSSLASGDDFHVNRVVRDNLWQFDLAQNNNDEEVLSRSRPCAYSPGNQSILTDYLQRHTKSVEAYRRIRKQQEEILSLCKKKLAKKLSRGFLDEVTDEDIVHALKIIQDTELKLRDPHTSDELLQCVLKAIVSDDKRPSNTEENESAHAHSRIIKWLSQIISTSSASGSKTRRKYSAVFDKLKKIFQKSASRQSPTNLIGGHAEHIARTQPLILYPKEYFEGGVVYPCLTEAHRQDSKTRTPSPHECPMGSKNICACHRNLIKLQNEFVKQQSEIRLINQNLQHCLCLLHAIGNKSQLHGPAHAPPNIRPDLKRRNPFKTNIHAFTTEITTNGPYDDNQHQTVVRKTSVVRKKGCRRRRVEEITVLGGCPPTCPYIQRRPKPSPMQAPPPAPEPEPEPPPPPPPPPARQSVIYTRESSPTITVVPQVKSGDKVVVEQKKKKACCACCTCCGRQKSSTAVIVTKEKKASALKGGRVRQKEKVVDPQYQRCCFCCKKPIKMRQEMVCSAACAIWSNESVVQNDTSPMQPASEELLINDNGSTIVRIPTENEISSAEEEPYNQGDPKSASHTKYEGAYIWCTKGQCSKRRGKSRQCQCLDCKFARKKIRGGDTPSTTSSWTNRSKSTAGRRRREATKSKIGKSMSRIRQSVSRIGTRKGKGGTGQSRKSKTGKSKSAMLLAKSKSKVQQSFNALKKSMSRIGGRRKSRTPTTTSNTTTAEETGSDTLSNKQSTRKNRGKSQTKAKIKQSMTHLRKSMSRIGGRRKSKMGGKTPSTTSTIGPSETTDELTKSSSARTPNKKRKRKRQCCLVKFCKMYICRGT